MMMLSCESYIYLNYGGLYIQGIYEGYKAHFFGSPEEGAPTASEQAHLLTHLRGHLQARCIFHCRIECLRAFAASSVTYDVT